MDVTPSCKGARPRSGTSYLYIARALRGFGDGFAAIVLPAYLSALGFSSLEIGIVGTSALLGSVVATLAVGALAARYGLRTLLLLCAALMLATGLGLASFHAFGAILIVAFVGTVNPTIGDIGVHVPLEQAFLADNVSDEERTRILARYSFVGALAISAGAATAATPDALVAMGVDKMRALETMFYVYGALGVITTLAYLRLPRARPKESSRAAYLGPSRRIIYRLAALFSIDAFASGFVAQSLLALWLFQRFGLSLAAASAFFFWSNILSAFSYPVAARLGRHFGLVNTMVFTHIPSSLCLILAALTPSLAVVIVLLLIRAALSQIDVPTRSSYVMAVVTPPERAAAASITAIPRSLASAISPSLSGALLASAFPGLPLVLCGGLKMIYDLSLLLSFRHVKPPEEQHRLGS